jgi:hypothetical protein
MLGHNDVAVVVKGCSIGAVFGTAPGAEVLFGSVLKEASSNFQGNVMDGVDTAEIWEFGWGDAQGFTLGVLAQSKK